MLSDVGLNDVCGSCGGKLAILICGLMAWTSESTCTEPKATPHLSENHRRQRRT